MTKQELHLEHKGSLITCGEDQCLGYLMVFPGHGVYDATHGIVDVTPEEAEIHNRLLDEAIIKGLDENCQVGQCGLFYLGKDADRFKVGTFCGKVISTDVQKSGAVVTFRRHGKTFRGRQREHEDCITFKRIS